MQSLFPLLLQYGPAGWPGSPAGSSIHPTPFLLWMSPALAARALPASRGTRAPGEGRWLGRGAAWGRGAQQARGAIFAEVSLGRSWVSAKMDASRLPGTVST